jgi:hypothetical protein
MQQITTITTTSTESPLPSNSGTSSLPNLAKTDSPRWNHTCLVQYCLVTATCSNRTFRTSLWSWRCLLALHVHLGNNLSEENKNIKLSLCAQSKVQTSVEHEGGTAPFQLQKNCEARSAMTACDQSLYYFASIILPFLHDLFVATPWIHGTETHGCGAAECTGYTLVRSNLILHIRVRSALNLGTRHKLYNRSLWPKTCFFLPEPNSERN